MKKFTSANDALDINYLIDRAVYYKSNPFADSALGQNKRMGLLFLNPSLRTRISTQIAARNLGIEVIILNIDKDGWNLELNEGAIMNGTKVEHIRDAAPVLGAYFDIIGVRTFPGLSNKEEDYNELLLSQLMHHSGIPIVSLESSTLHPLQSLADLVTIWENHNKITRPKIVLTWAPHIKPIPHCVANSFAQWINKWDNADFVITHPEGYELSEQFTDGANIMHHQKEALAGADFVYVKNWSSYNDYGKVCCEDSSWMLTEQHLIDAPDAKVMHCLPVRRNIELSDEILDGKRSLVTQQGANRVWATQAVLAEILKMS
ncbi:MAG: acetylornithine carbamoyltransferase [Chitinophagaceae bacterium]|jgi:N-succinyl-L-ornithine transcarbamylase